MPSGSRRWLLLGSSALPALTPIDPATCSTIPGWFPPPHGLAALKQTYGKFYVVDGAIVPEVWEERNMVMLRDLPGVTGRLYVNRLVAPILRAALAACVALKDGYTIKTLGCFAPRPKRINGDLSTHSWGIAVDLNAAQNPMRSPMVRDIPDAWIAEFEKRGFTWGGRFPTPDAMHFQYVSGY